MTIPGHRVLYMVVSALSLKEEILEQWFSNLQCALGSLLKHRWLGPIPRVPDSVGLE